MSRRLPVPPPPGSPPEPRDPHDDDDVPEEAAWDDSLDDDDDDVELLDPSAWPDDLDEPTVPEGLLESETDLDNLPELSADDEEGDEEVAFPLEDLPLDDDLTDLTAPDDLELPVLPWALDVQLDGVDVPARLDPGAERTRFRTPAATGPRAHVVLSVAGVVVRLEVEVEAADRPQVVLGRDVLAGRFLLRP